ISPLQVNDRVWYWSAASQTVFGTVVAIERLADVSECFIWFYTSWGVEGRKEGSLLFGGGP
ncbi:hypothetical protein K525DRAFT_215183, partial [Schizophyllum commune Loenen D]